MADNRNMFIAIALSLAVIIAWQFLYVQPRMEQDAAALREQQARAAQASLPAAGAIPGAPASAIPAAPGGEIPGVPGVAAPAASAAPAADAPRVRLATPSLDGSISLVGARIDDVKLRNYRLTVDPASPEVVLLAPVGTTDPYFVETGWVPAAAGLAVPGATTLWTVESGDTLAPDTPVTLVWDNGAGLVFRRVLSVDAQSMFTVRQTVENRNAAAVTLFPYSRVRRQGAVSASGFFILHEGMIGVLGEEGLQQWSYAAMADEDPQVVNGVPTANRVVEFPDATGGWLGITDKYWATAVIPQQGTTYKPRYFYTESNGVPAWQADFRGAGVEIAPGATGETTSQVFAGAKKTGIVQAYESDLRIDRFNLLIDWGWFYFLTKPMFYLIDYIQSLVGNFGVSILITTVLMKLLFFPLASKAYASMAKMKALQPKVKALQDRFKDDKTKQQQEMMELYKKEKVNPLAGCIPILIQIPVFFALYKVIFVSIEMRHAPFFGWIQDLSAPDPTQLFNLFGLLPYDPLSVPVIGPFIAIGIWPIIMGVTMWVQMKMNPTPPDPTQAMIFNWMPIIFTFMLASFPAGLVIYWAWNNTLSVAQQALIMRRHGVKVELWDNIVGIFRRKKKEGAA